MSEKNIQDYIKQEISDSEVLLFMKGTPVFPQCGFSSTVVQILTQVGVKYKSIDVLSDNEIRQGIKEFSDWPTIPQLYIKGEFVGGCDIITEMYQSGELNTFLESKGIELQKPSI
ncbi:MAG: monothiol glutaredoxin, Grx4 family [Rhodospirillaceae bacterium]|nr:monothiol glutaredoxin, Grx4 family [Rhodospirillaceae bacterium]|tara:strand:+ start:157 stop:501 length:345 start_codon:yes stop_codon:yes gene_type:complete